MEKLIKSVNNIKLYYASEEDDPDKETLPVSTKNERQECCKTMTETVLSNAIKTNSDYPTYLGITLETLLLCCKDAEADVRIAAEESINRIINGTEESHFSKVLIEFYKEIKRNGSSRSLRAALSRFSNLAHRIRPSKCRPYIMGLIPVFIQICSREDEGIQECLSTSIAKIFSLIGSFASETEVRDLINASMKNLSHNSAAIRRNAASCIYEVVNNCNKRNQILSSTLSDLLSLFCDTVKETNHALGVITTLRHLVPIIGTQDPSDLRRTGSFGSETNAIFNVSFESLVVNIFELCLRLLHSEDQNIITASLETMQALLRLPCDLLRKLLVHEMLPDTQFSKDVARHILPEMASSEMKNSQGQQNNAVSSVQISEQTLESADQSEEDIEIPENLSGSNLPGPDDTEMALCPLNDLTRLLCEKVLQIGVETNKSVRVSAKSLALSCVGTILKIRPEMMFVKVNSKSKLKVQEVMTFGNFYDPQIRGCVLLLISQYLDSALTTSKGDYMSWVDSGDSTISIDGLVDNIRIGMMDESTVCVRAAIQATSTCLQSLRWTDYAHLGVKLIEQLLLLTNSSYWLVKVDVLDALSDVNIREMLFPRETSHDMKASNNYDLLSTLCDEITQAGFNALGDKDSRVRKAASTMLVKSVGRKGFVISAVKCDMATSQIAEVCGKFIITEGSSDDQSPKASAKSLLKTYRGFEVSNEVSYVAHNLSSLVGKVSELLSFSTSKHLVQGCIQVLLTLSTEYAISKHPASYDCHFCTDPKLHEERQQTGLLTTLLSLIDSHWPPLDIGAYANAVTLAGNYIAGIACHGFQIVGANPKLTGSDSLLAAKGANPEIATSLSAFKDQKIGALALRFFTHIAKLLSMLHHVISNSAPSLPNKSVLQTLQSGTLPGNLKKKDKGDTKEIAGVSKTQKKTSSTGKATQDDNEKPAKNAHALIFSFAHSRVHMRLYDTLLGAYETYKTTLDIDEVDKFSLFLGTVLDAFSQLLEIITFDDIEKYAEDILTYLKTVFTVAPTMTVQTVQQLLKGIFGTNLVNQLDLDDQTAVKINTAAGRDLQRHKATFYHQAFHRPLNDFTMAIANSSFHHYLQQENAPKASSGWFGSIKKKVEQKLNMTAKRSKGDKASIQSYIRLFESIVIKSLKNYTMTSSAEFQKHVLNLLAQLVQLRVNYCLLDSDMIFIGFIVRQFESIESGLVRNSTVLIPHVFFFLVLLSYEKHHSKSVIAMPKIIQLCDGVMAGGCDAATHVIPALRPIVHDLFVLRAGLRQEAASDLDTQREVTQSMLFRIVEHPEALRMVTTVLQYYRKESPEQWKKYSRQVTDVLLPMMSHSKVRVGSRSDTIVLHSLLEALSPAALRPIDLVLNIFFMLPADLGSLTDHQRWIVKTNALSRVLLCQLNEDFLLQRIQEMCVDPDAFASGILAVMKSGCEESVDADDQMRGAEASPPAEEVFAKVCLQIVGFTIERVVSETFDPVKIDSKENDVELLADLLSEFILSLTYIGRCGNFKKVSGAMRNLLSEQEQDGKFYSSVALCSFFQEAASKYPTVSLFWSQFLACVGFMDLAQWGKLTGKNSQSSASMPVLNVGMVHRGAVIMLADYVCQNQSEVEAMSWLIVNHVKEVLTLHGEPPIQDFISVIHRNSAASRLFVESIMTLFARGDKIKTLLKQRLLGCMSGLHLNQSDLIVALLLSEDWFVFSPVIAISCSAERLACERFEMIMVRASEKQGSAENEALLARVTELQRDLGRCESIPRLGRLVGLSNRLKHLLETGEDDPKSARRPNVNTSPGFVSEPDQTWFKSHVDDSIIRNYHGRDLAVLLNVLDYEDIMEVFQRDAFDVEKLDECLRFAFRDIAQPDDGIARDVSSSSLLSATVTALVAHLKSFVDQLPEMDATLCENTDAPTISVEGDTSMSQYWRSSLAVFDVVQNQTLVSVLAKSFTRCLMWQKAISYQFPGLAESDADLLKLVVSFHQYLIWCVLHSKTIDTYVIATCCDFLHQAVSVVKIRRMFFDAANVFHPTVITNSLYALYRHFTENLGLSNSQSSVVFDAVFSKNKVSPLFTVLKACQLLDDVNANSLVPAVLRKSLEKSMKLVLCHPLFNQLARVPPLLIKSDVTVEEIKAIADEPPASYLSEKDLLQGFVSRINAIGWTSRMQFEETWTTLLGVLVSQPIRDMIQNAAPVDETAIQVSCLTISSLTALVVMASMKPCGGQPWLGAYPNVPRRNMRPAPDSKIGHELNSIQCVVDKELDEILLADSLGQQFERYRVSSHCMIVQNLDLVAQDFLQSRLELNLERADRSPLHYGIGQKSVNSFWAIQGISHAEEDSIQDSSDDESDASSTKMNDENTADASQELTVVPRVTPTGGDPYHESVDVHSCIQFLIDLYSEWFRSASTTPVSNQQSGTPVSFRLPRQFLNECLRSLILVSDFFVDRQQLEWMFASLNSLQSVQPSEDDVMLQYLVLGMCKSAAILGLNRKSCDVLHGMLDAAFSSTVISSQTFALHGALYVLESEIKDFMKPIIGLISKFVYDKLRSVGSEAIFASHQFLRNIISVGSYLVEKARAFIPSAHVNEIVRAIIDILSSPRAKSVSNDVYAMMLKTLESLITSCSVSAAECEAIAKFASEQFAAHSAPVTLLSSLNLMVTCLYFHMLRLPDSGDGEESALEFRLLSMERISLIFDKLKTGFPYKSRLLVRILPTLMDNFFSTQDMMNKIIGEFASGTHPQPELLAHVLYNIFQILHARGESMVVSEWVMLTLRNFTQRTPIWSAIWRLSCIFVSASTNHWINSAMPMVLKEANMAPEDRNFDFFYVSAKDFYSNQLITELDKRSFVSTFQSVAEPDNFYQNMLDLIT